MDFFCMLENPNNITQHCYPHVFEVFFGQIYQHVLLNAIICENDGIVCCLPCWYPTFCEKLYPKGCVCKMDAFQFTNRRYFQSKYQLEKMISFKVFNV